MTWMLFWKICLVAVLAVFSVTALLVTVLGARDVGKLLRGLKGEDGDAEREDGKSQSPISE